MSRRRLSGNRSFAAASALALGMGWAGLVPAPLVAADDEVAAILADGALSETRNPVVANFLLEEGAPLLTESERATALDQLKTALSAQTQFMTLMMQGAGGVLSTPSFRAMQEAGKKAVSVKGLVTLGVLGVGPAMPTPQAGQMEREIRQAMTDPWVRGIAAAQALEKAGEDQGAARFYVNCLQLLQAEWVPDACLDGLVDLGPARAEKVFVWMLDNAETLSMTNMAGVGRFGGLGGLGGETEKKPKDLPPDPGIVQLRNAALEGLGALVGSGELSPEAKERALARLLAYAVGKQNEPYQRGVAEGLGRSRDPRALEALRRLAKNRRNPEAKQAALRGLVVGFHDQAATRQLRGELDDHDPEEQIRAAQALYESGDEAAFRWAVEVIGKRRVMEAKKPDIRARVVRDLVELGGTRARSALAQALAEGPPNDWLTAWVRVGLLELGDASQLPAIEAALAKEDWALDPRGFLSVWRAIKPILYAVATSVATAGLAAPSTLKQIRQAVQLIGNLAQGERSRFLAKANQREAAIAQLRWQTADALAASQPPGAARVLEGLLATPEPAVRLSAALALVRLDQPEAISGLTKAFDLDYGVENGVPRTPEVRASLLRAARLRFPADPRTAQLFARAGKDGDPAVRLIARVGKRKAA
ncbi:MAG TPA: HEAT repeat domain-containing protein [Thermoanaerobaculia bacterium]|nr:HEAT repeat domain-containing protein [Thermoanaerobaculia bacterium]